MIIIMFVMSPFTYPNMLLYSHGVITVLCDLQIFVSSTNEGATRVHCKAALATGTSSATTTFVVVP
jgi:hypothetical protein